MLRSNASIGHLSKTCGLLAQLDRVLASGARSHKFESCIAHHMKVKGHGQPTMAFSVFLVGICYAFMRFLPRPSRPIRPAPKRMKVDGSGVGTGSEEDAEKSPVGLM